MWCAVEKVKCEMSEKSEDKVMLCVLLRSFTWLMTRYITLDFEVYEKIYTFRRQTTSHHSALKKPSNNNISLEKRGESKHCRHRAGYIWEIMNRHLTSRASKDENHARYENVTFAVASQRQVRQVRVSQRREFRRPWQLASWYWSAFGGTSNDEWAARIYPLPFVRIAAYGWEEFLCTALWEAASVYLVVFFSFLGYLCSLIQHQHNHPCRLKTPWNAANMYCTSSNRLIRQ